MMGSKVMEELMATAKSVAGSEHSDMDILRALHMAKNDVNAAINILFDTPKKPKYSPTVKNLGSVFSVSPNSKNSFRRSDTTINDLEVSCSTLQSEWWLVGSCDVTGLSTCRGRDVQAGEKIFMSFPIKERKAGSTSSGKGFGRGRQETSVAACSAIVRFSTATSGELGRIPNEWALCLLPLVRDNKVKVEGICKSTCNKLEMMQSIDLMISVYLNSSMFQTHQKATLKPSNDSFGESVVHPLPNLFRLLGLTPFKKAQLTHSDLLSRKRPQSFKLTSGPLASLSSANKSKSTNENENEIETLSDADLDCIVGVGNNNLLEEMEPSSALQCHLRPYQKQALWWMVNLEKGVCNNETSSLHPCWEGYMLADKRELVIYLNAFSGKATVKFPSTLEMARGGILADAMGLGKTVMTISLLLSHSENNSLNSISSSTPFCTDQPSNSAKKKLINGGNLIVCPMTLLSQWKAEIETHVNPGTVSVYLHYGQGRMKDAKTLANYNIVITTYGVLTSEFSSEDSAENGVIYSVKWYRVVLDEAHAIKSPRSQISVAATALCSDRRWCLTGTPIQNNLEDIYSLLRFLKVEPWSSWAWWNKLIQKPFEEGDERSLKLVQSLLKPIMLRRTKSTTDQLGRPILILPPADTEVIYCELSVTEKDFYDALFKRSKVKFDQFVEQGRVLHNYASILELLLRLRQCCDHPFLVMSRGDTQNFSDLDKLAKRFLKSEEKFDVSKAFVEEVVEELRKGEPGECPICLEAYEDAILTPCAHRICRECLLASWRNHASGSCPVCRKFITKNDLLTAPSQSRFRVDIEKDWVESSKITRLLKELEAPRCSTSKTILFSQWTAFLDLLQIPLRRNNISFLRLDGTLSQHKREQVIKQFSEDSSITVLLMSLRAGGVGINLTAASNAFLMDPWWNPAVEEQAVMRIHRIGQTQRVNIKRFIVKGTVEERMEAVQARKQRLISGALTDQQVRSARIEELKMLFT